MTALQAINRLYEEFQKEIYDVPADEATISYLLERLSEAKELVIDEYDVEQSSKKIIITATLAIVSVVNFLHFLSTYSFVQLLQLSIFLSTYPADASFLLWFSFIFFSSIALFSSFSFSSFIIRYILRTIFSTFLTSLSCLLCRHYSPRPSNPLL